MNVFDATTTTEVHIFAGADEHPRGSYDIRNRVFLWVISSDPDRDGDVVGCLTIDNGKSPMKTEQQLGSSIVVSCVEQSESERRWIEREMDWTVDVSLRTDLGEFREKSVGVGVHGV